MGLVITKFDEVPPELAHPTDRRHYFDTRVEGKFAVGHDFAEALDADERNAVLEYLKTL